MLIEVHDFLSSAFLKSDRKTRLDFLSVNFNPMSKLSLEAVAYVVASCNNDKFMRVDVGLKNDAQSSAAAIRDKPKAWPA